MQILNNLQHSSSPDHIIRNWIKGQSTLVRKDFNLFLLNFFFLMVQEDDESLGFGMDLSHPKLYMPSPPWAQTSPKAPTDDILLQRVIQRTNRTQNWRSVNWEWWPGLNNNSGGISRAGFQFSCLIRCFNSQNLFSCWNCWICYFPQPKAQTNPTSC